MKFELTNIQREYLGLDSIATTWDRETLQGDTYRPDSIIYFDRETLRRHIVSTDNEYKETQYNESTTLVATYIDCQTLFSFSKGMS